MTSSSEGSAGRAQMYRIGPRLRISRIRGRGPIYPDPIRSAADVHRLLGAEAASWDRERFLSLLLDGRNRVIGIDEVSVGTATAALVHPREVFKVALLANAVAVILVHNHPSGDAGPSQEDIALTTRLAQAGELLGVRLIDHIILGDESYRSLAEEGKL